MRSFIVRTSSPRTHRKVSSPVEVNHLRFKICSRAKSAASTGYKGVRKTVLFIRSSAEPKTQPYFLSPDYSIVGVSLARPQKALSIITKSSLFRYRSSGNVSGLRTRIKRFSHAFQFESRVRLPATASRCLERVDLAVEQIRVEF